MRSNSILSPDTLAQKRTFCLYVKTVFKKHPPSLFKAMATYHAEALAKKKTTGKTLKGAYHAQSIYVTS